MRKHRVLAVFLAVVMLLGTMPAALAASVTTNDGIQLDKTAGSLNAAYETQVKLTVSAPAVTTGPVAVEFVLDGTDSMFKNADNDMMLVKVWGDAIQKELKDKNVYVGVTIFGSEAKNVYPLTKLTSISNLNLDSAENIGWLVEHTGTNVQAGIRAGMEKLNALGSTVAPENRYLVLVTDGGTFWRLDANGDAINDKTSTDTLLQNNDAAELDVSGKTLKSNGSFAALMGAIVPTAPYTYAGPTLADAMDKIQQDTLYTNFEKGVYAAAKELDAMQNAKLITVSYPYYAQGNGLEQLTSLAEGLMTKAANQSVYSVSMRNVVATTEQINNITKGISTAIGVGGAAGATLPKGSTITDKIGTGTDNLKADYNFDLLPDKGFTLTVAGTAYTGTRSGNTWTFGDGSELVYTPGGSEQFVFTLGQTLLSGQTLTLTYTAKLTNPSNANGIHWVYPNVSATLTPANSRTGTDFPKPELSYRIGGGSDGGGSTLLNTDDHYSYIIGYKDGYLRPYGTITRGEVATIFFRLLTDETRDKYWSQENDYSDCNKNLWCNNAISTLSSMGIIDGFNDGTFRPYGKITRAQFAKIAVGFFETTREEYQAYYKDVPENAWFTDYVEAASRVGLIQGFEDGNFRPNQNITRAQACVIVNRALGRKPDMDHLLTNGTMIVWPDNNRSDWFYADMQEATNSHDYKWMTVGNDARGMEQWTKKLEQRDWAAFEHAWSTAHSAPGGEVVK